MIAIQVTITLATFCLLISLLAYAWEVITDLRDENRELQAEINKSKHVQTYTFETKKRNILQHRSHIEVPFEMINQDIGNYKVPDVVKHDLKILLVDLLDSYIDYHIEPNYMKLSWDCYAMLETLERDNK